ncbi:DENN domain-containing protein 2A-like isoform X2 [Anneissia japonica]|uniref:DENN domain-containing protein 2A-like isoform X2 n=1 Tax=Anneissia japonica TaxID=1529436 RepID=UPI00142569B3|nr:DENN domain-containing protein 2A-like isoform X2 [Anneissia japonica]
MSRQSASVPLTPNPLHPKNKHFEKCTETVEFSKSRHSTNWLQPEIDVRNQSQFEPVNNQNHRKTETNGIHVKSTHSALKGVRPNFILNANIQRTNAIKRTSGGGFTPSSHRKTESLLQVPRYERRLPTKRTGLELQTRYIGQDPRRHETRSVIEKQSPRINKDLLHPHWSVAGLPSETYRAMEPNQHPVKSRPEARNVLTQVLKKRAAVEPPNREQHSSTNVQMRYNNGVETASSSEDDKRNSVFDRVKAFENIEKCPNTNSNRAVKNEHNEPEDVAHVSLNPRVINSEPQKLNLHHTYENQDCKEKEGTSPQIAPKPSIKPKNIHVQNVFQQKKKNMSSPKVHTYEDVAEDENDLEDDSRFAGGGSHEKPHFSIPVQPVKLREGANKAGRRGHRERSIVILGPTWKKDKVGKDGDRPESSCESPEYEDVYEGDDTEPDVNKPSNIVQKPKQKDKKAKNFIVYEDVFVGKTVSDKVIIAPSASPSAGSKPLPPPKPKILKNPPYFVLERTSADNESPHSPDLRTQSNGDMRQSLFQFQSYKTPYVLADTSGMIDLPLSPTGRHAKNNLYDKPLLLSQRSASAEDIFQQKATIEDGSGYSIPGSHLWRAHSFTEQGDEKSSSPEKTVRFVPLKDEESTSTGKTKEKKGRLQTIQRRINNAFRRKENSKHTRESTVSEDRSSVASEDSDGDINEVEHKKRLTEIRRRRSRSQYCSVDRIRHYARYEKLFEYVVVVSLRNNSEKRRFEPYEVRRFPQEVEGMDKLIAIPHFCFPDAFKWAPVEQYRSETFSFVLTSEDGSRLYGYCRRLLPPGDGPRLPEVYCIISPIGCFPLYEKLLDLMEDRRKITPVHVDVLLKAAIARKFPSPGTAVELRVPTYTGTEEHSLRRPLDSRLEQVDFEFLRSNLDHHMFIQMFASLLMERRIIMCSGDLEILSQCSQAAAALLYPFSWQHVYIPILPEKLIDMVCSPTPYIIGMLSIGIPKLDDLPLDEVLVIDLDSRDFHYVIGDEWSIIPKKLYNALLRALTIVSQSASSHDSPEALDPYDDAETVNAAISEVFIRFFVETCGHYLNYMLPKPDGTYKFDRDGFLKAMPSKSIRKFLEVFTESQMFSLFIQEKEMCDEGLPQGLFEKKIREYEAETKNHARFGNKVKNIGKFIKDSGQRWNGMKIRIAANFDDRV